MLSEDFKARFQGKAMTITKTGMTGIIASKMNPVEKEGWREFLDNMTQQQNQDAQKKLMKEIKQINNIQRKVLPKLSKLNKFPSTQLTLLEHSKVMKTMPKRDRKQTQKIKTLINQNFQSLAQGGYKNPRIGSNLRSSPSKLFNKKLSPSEAKRKHFTRSRSSAAIYSKTPMVGRQNRSQMFKNMSKQVRSDSNNRVLKKQNTMSTLNTNYRKRHVQKYIDDHTLNSRETWMSQSQQFARRNNNLNQYLQDMRKENRDIFKSSKMMGGYDKGRMARSNILKNYSQQLIPINNSISNIRTPKKSTKAKKFSSLGRAILDIQNPSVVTSPSPFYR